MKKGDLRKQEFLRTAEILFCKNGYEKTSVQDILDVLDSSKGSFYHHFVSKESLLEAIFLSHSEQALSALSEIGERDPVRRINSLLSGMIPFHDEQLSFLIMLLHVFDLPEGRTMKEAYCSCLEKVFIPSLSSSISEGEKDGVLLSPDPDLLAGICICITNRLWITICELIVRNERNGTFTEAGDILHALDLYRSSLEKILSVPFGSLTLLDVPSVRLLIDSIHAHWTW